MINLTPEQKQSKTRKLAFEQGISEIEAQELLELLLSQDFEEGFSDDDSLGEQEEEGWDGLEQDVADNELDMQISQDNNDQEGFQEAEKGFQTSLAKLRQARKAKKVAVGLLDEPMAPEKQHIDKLMMRAEKEFAQDPNVTPETQEYARQMMADMKGAGNMPDDEEQDYQMYLDLLGKGENRVNMALAKLADPRFGVPKKEGKLYRSTVCPRYFKSASGKLYKLALDDYDTQMQSDETVPPTMPSEGQPPVDTQTVQEDAQHSLGEPEKQRLNQIIADAEANGSSSFTLIGLVAGFMNDRKLLGIAASQQEVQEMNEAFRQGQLARGGSQEQAPAAPVGV